MLLAWPPPLGVAPFVCIAALAAVAPFVVLPPLAAGAPPGDNREFGVTAPRVPMTSLCVAPIVPVTSLAAAPLAADSVFGRFGQNP